MEQEKMTRLEAIRESMTKYAPVTDSINPWRNRWSNDVVFLMGHIDVLDTMLRKNREEYSRRTAARVGQIMDLASALDQTEDAANALLEANEAMEGMLRQALQFFREDIKLGHPDWDKVKALAASIEELLNPEGAEAAEEHSKEKAAPDGEYEARMRVKPSQMLGCNRHDEGQTHLDPEEEEKAIDEAADFRRDWSRGVFTLKGGCDGQKQTAVRIEGGGRP
jgi:hypothetical protein